MFKRILSIVMVVAMVLTFASGLEMKVSADTVAVTVNLNGASVVPDRTYEGIGTVSAGASSKLLFDYPEPYRSDILDYLFKPKFGLNLQHLKVEIGGGENSTNGAEPSHAITRAELSSPVARGYEFWLMQQARLRNPDIILDALPWSYPSWIAGYNTQDSADWIVAFLKVAKNQYNLDINLITAAWNETAFDGTWVKDILRPTLNANGFTNVKLAGPDYGGTEWNHTIYGNMSSDSDMMSLLSGIGYHYDLTPTDIFTPGPTAINSGKPLWGSEVHSYEPGDWNNAINIARTHNVEYIKNKMTKTEWWYALDGMYSDLPYADYGGMRANSPWSGSYKMLPGGWTIAHMTQFVQPGWKYLIDGNGQINGSWNGTYVSLKDNTSSNWSTVVVTDAATTMTVNISGGLSAEQVYVWKSDATNQFIQQTVKIPSSNSFTVNLDADAVYTLTTTTGQQKGEAGHAIPADQPFPFPYQENFESYNVGDTPKYITDQKGTFEVIQLAGQSKSLKQILPAEGIKWPNGPVAPFPNTIFGDNSWTDYIISSDVYIDGGSVEVGARWVSSGDLGYRLSLNKTGTWIVYYKTAQLGTGTISGFNGSSWHNLKLSLNGASINAYVDGIKVKQLTDTSRSFGRAFVSSSYNPNQIDNISVTSVDGTYPIPWTNMVATASSSQEGYEPGKAIDGNTSSIWHSEWAPLAALPQYVTLNLGGSYNINKLVYFPRKDSSSGHITAYEISTSMDGTNFTAVKTGSWADDYNSKAESFSPVTAKYIRLKATAGINNVASTAELKVYTSPITATASSQHVGYEANQAVDGNPGTMWHSEWSPLAALPQYITLDLGAASNVTKLLYTPRQDGLSNGNITSYTVSVSTNGTTFTSVKSGTWASDATQKQAVFTPTSARYVRLTATAGYGNFASAAEISVE